MMRINLRESSKNEGPRRSVILPEIQRRSRSPLLKIVIVALTCGATNLAYWRHLESVDASLISQLEQSDKRSRAVAQVKPAYLERQKQAETCKSRLAVIERLRSLASGPSDLLMTVADTVNRTDAVWLNH